jgi:UDP-N-acetyl-2-amino-2-deoxyglucuronate dehydrogenase
MGSSRGASVQTGGTLDVGNFALIGAAGFVAPRHLKAIAETENALVAAVDPHDAAGILDRHFPEARFFTEIERFDRFLEKRRRGPAAERIHWVSICSPNYLHDAHLRMALRAGAQAICEKPMVVNPWNLDALEVIEQETGCRIFTVLQLRLHPALVALREEMRARPAGPPAEVQLSYVTRRGPWYDVSWKGSEEKSGGVAMNIGIHFFDLLLWLFGAVAESRVHLREPRRMAGSLRLERARVRWFLSVDARDLPPGYAEAQRAAFRSITIDGREIEFSEGFADLHTRLYEETLAGRGFGVAEARPSIELVYRIRRDSLATPDDECHPAARA